jgi:putative transposase
LISLQSWFGFSLFVQKLKLTISFKVVVWRLRYKLSLRDLSEMFEGEGVTFSHQTVHAWEANFAPLLEQAAKSERKGQASYSWYADETLIKIKKQGHYYYRAIDNQGALVATRLSQTRDLENSTAFLVQAVQTVGHLPHRVTTDGESSYPGAIEAALGKRVEHPTNKYLNNKLEQDHRGVKGRVKSMLGFKNPASASRFLGVFDEQRHYFRPRKYLKAKVSALQRRVHFRGQLLRLKHQFRDEKLHGHQLTLF